MPRALLLAALLLALLAGPPVSASITVAPQKPSVTGDAVHLAYAQRWDEAIQQSRSGNTLGALITIEQLMEDPLLDDFDAEHRGRAAQVAGWTAMMQKQPDQARRYLQRALEALPVDAQILLTLVSLELSQGQPAAATNYLVRALQHADAPLPLEPDTVRYLQYRVHAQPQQRMELLQALFDNGWKSGGLEPTGMWLALATLQAENGRDEDIPATLARISGPAEIIRLRSDKRFDHYVDRSDPRFDAMQGAQQHLDELRVSGLLDRALDGRMAEFGSTLLMLDRNEEVLALTDGMARAAAAGESPSDAEAEWVGRLLNNRYTALRRLGRLDDALAAAQQAARIGARGPNGIEHQLSVGFLFLSLGRPQEAVQAVQGIQDLPGYGKAAQALVQFAAARGRGDTGAMEAARDVILAEREGASVFHREMLLEAGDLDGAAAVLIEQLRSPVERGEILASLQDMRTYPSLPGDARGDAAWRALKQRADVQAAIERVGRVERYDLVSSGTSR
ncbi:tetratricopeptide repeat protein [Stenotrophomonas maltophilia]|uniref:tetratricopeptide repeat protein n=1 Tax=Stenotrophomonas maltophilia TaxID=40324 RepID=UPI0034DB5D1F